MRPAPQQGFTLAELMVALLVFSFVATAGVYALRLAVESREQLEEADGYIRQVELMREFLRRDLYQIAPRPVRDEFGAPAPTWFYGGASHPVTLSDRDEALLFSFVRRGWINPEAREPRSDLQYVQYVFKGGALVRRIRPYLDDARDQPHTDKVLIGNVSNVRASFLRGETRGRLDWIEDWPSGQTAEQPEAVRVSLTDRRYGDIDYLFLVGEAPAVASQQQSQGLIDDEDDNEDARDDGEDDF
ncbi:MAG: type II secretion system minor pseudopilin GspJ [Pseudomonadota bacterium]